MVKEKRKRLGNMPSPSTVKSLTNASEFRIRKCVVKIKRLKLQLNNTASNNITKPYNLRKCRVRISNVKHKSLSLPRIVNRRQASEESLFEPAVNSTMCLLRTPAIPCKIQSRRMSSNAVNTAEISGKTAPKAVPTIPCKIQTRCKTLAHTAENTSVVTTSENIPKAASTIPCKIQTRCKTLAHTGEKTSKVTADENATKVASTTPCKVQVRRMSYAPAEVTAGPVEGGAKEKENQEHVFFHRDQPPTRTRSSVTRHVYEYLSESQIDDGALNQRKDPAADIIKKMIDKGKVCVMTRKMGKTCQKKKRLRPVGKRKQCALKNKSETEKDELQPQIERPLSPIYEPQLDLDNDDNYADEATNIEEPVEVHTSPKPQQTTAEGGYSHLARSLLQQQTDAQQPLKNSEERRRQLLHMVRKHYSTPINSKQAAGERHSLGFLSPVRRTTPVVSSPSGDSSPWRVPDEAPMPNTFVFGFNTSQLPSYSSDHIQRSHVYVPDEPMQNNNESILPVLDEPTNNDSNGENVPPLRESVSAVSQQQLEKTNENEENFVQLPNPRRTLQQRTPFKDINILDVVVLPSWKQNLQQPKTPSKENKSRNHVHSEKSIENSMNTSKQQQINVQRSPRNLFGFEEFITDDDQEQSVAPINQNTTLHEKLQRLKGLRPLEKELPTISKAAMRYDYDDLTARNPKQCSIKQMLCSTMVATSNPANNESNNLFKDLDPEVTFDETKPRRTYVRERPKRKRKRVHVLFVDSDSSESEEDEQDSSADSPEKAVPVKKRVRRDVEFEKQLQNFVTSFNQECEEVEKFPLIVE